MYFLSDDPYQWILEGSDGWTDKNCQMITVTPLPTLCGKGQLAGFHPVGGTPINDPGKLKTKMILCKDM